MPVTAPVRLNPRLREDYQWTERQREVLWMLVKGHSNGRIAEELGISLDGAKWHVREIMSKLGVDSRDEAAEYWRAYNGLSLRFSRLFRAVFGTTSLKWIAGGAGGAAAVTALGVVVIVLVLGAIGDDQDESGSAPGEDGAPTGVTPVPGTPAVAVRASTLAPSVQSSREAVLYTVTGCFQCDGSDESLQRHVTNAAGVMTTTTVLESRKGPLAGWTLGALSAAPDAALLVAVVCDQSYCGGLGPGEPGTTWRIVGSTDDGTTWREVLSMQARYLQVSSVSQAGLVALAVTGDESQPNRAYFAVTPSGQRPLPPPAALAGPAEPVLLGDGRVFWLVSGSTRVVDEQGDAIALVVPPGATQVVSGGIRALANGGLAVSYVDGSIPNRYAEIVEVYDTALAPVGGLSGGAAFQVVPVSTRLALAGILGTEIGLDDQATVYPALIDLEKGTVTPVAAKVFTDQRGRNRLVAARAGTFAVVSTGGDCLNVREEPTTAAPALGCFPDGTLLGDRAETRETNGATWQAVVAPGGRIGWASLEYLVR